MDKKDILLLGGAGFIGKSLAGDLLKRGHTIHIVAPNSAKDLPRGVILHRGTFSDSAILEDVLPCCSTIFHLASGSTPGSSAHEPVFEGEQNILPSLRLLEKLQDKEELHLIYFSSGGAIYGTPEALPVNETHPLKPKSYHGAGKAAIEVFLQTFGQRPGKNVTILRPSNIYGPGQPLRKGFGVVRTMLEHLLQNTTLEIWGDGETVRDFLYIDDLTKACMQAMDAQPENAIYNVGFGRGYSLNQLIHVIETVTEQKFHIQYREERLVDVKEVFLDIAKIRDDLGWQPQVTLEEGIRRTWNWMKNF